MKIAIRVDSSLLIGTGHVMRCLTLAEKLRHKNGKIVFVCREHPGHLCEMISAKGFGVARLKYEPSNMQFYPPPQLAHASWLSVSQAADASETIAALQDDAPWDWIIIDHYALDYQWESAVRQSTGKIMVIDDLADRKHDCDLLLDQNYFQAQNTRYQELVPNHCTTLIGPNYALLRPEFYEARKFCRMRGNGIARVLIYFGGNDPDNLTGMALAALNDPNLSHLLLDAVIGINNQHRPEIIKLVQNRPGTRLHIQPEEFTELMLRADLCIGAGGTTTWERLCLGLPSLVVIMANNQTEFTNFLDKKGYIKLIGNNKNMTSYIIRDALLNIISNFHSDENYSMPKNIVDGLGSDRVIKFIIPEFA